MSLYVNRVRYKGGSPTLGASSGIINNAMINGHSFYDDDYIPINYVTELKMSNPRAINTSTISDHSRLDTGITLTQDLKWRAVFTIYKQDGGVVFGYGGSGNSSYRAFTYGVQIYFDIGNSRIGAGWGIDGMQVNYDGSTVYDVTFNNFYYTNNDTGVTYNSGGHATSTINNSNFYVCLDSIGLRTIQIYDSTGASLVFDGWPALDENNQPCIYDKISQTYKYFTVPSGSASGYVTYKSLTPCNVTLSVNDSTMGTTNGGGTYYVGDSVSISATSNIGYRFVGWYDGNTLLSSNSTYSFTIYNNVSYEARFEAIPQYTITLSVNDATMGSTSGDGTYYEGSTVTIVASSNIGYRFVGWYDGDTLVSNSHVYSFTINDNVSYEAMFEVSTSNYTLVDSIYMSSPKTYGGVLPTAYDHIYFNTGVTINKDLKWRAIFSMYGTNGGCVFGRIDYTNDGLDYRVFNYQNKLIFDMQSSRLDRYRLNNNTIVDFTFGNYYYTNNNTSTTYNASTITTTLNTSNFVISMNTIKLKEFWLWATDGTTLLFHGQPAIDTNNTACLYDSVSDSLIYPIYQNNTTACGTLTYSA